MTDRATLVSLTPQHPVRIASITKTFVATAILRLCEQGLLGLDESIANRLPSDFLEMMRRDGYEPEISPSYAE